MAAKELDTVSMGILRALKDASTPAGCGDVAKQMGVPSSQVVCRMAPLRKRGLIDSPEKSKYVITPAGAEACG